MLAPILLVLSLLSLASAEVKDVLTLGASLTENDACKLSFPKTGDTFDLCPLFGPGGHTAGETAWEDRTPPTITRTELRWRFTGPLPHPENATERCPRSARAA
jgi:hypothetical protein